jgi:HlyD family secretion protein
MALLKHFSLKTAVSAALVIAVLSGVFFLFKSRPAQGMNNDGSLVEYQVKRGSIRSAVSAAGTTFAAGNRSIMGPYGSTVDKVYCSENREVKKGDLLFSLSNDSALLDLKRARFILEEREKALSQLKAAEGELAIYSPAGGIVKAVSIREGDRVPASNGGTSISPVAILDTSAMKFTISPAAAGDGEELLDIMKAGQLFEMSADGVGGTRQVTVDSIKSAYEGNYVTFRVADPRGLQWEGYYNLNIKVDSTSSISARVQLTGDVEYAPVLQEGVVKKLLVKAGDAVVKNQQLVVLENDSLISQIQLAEMDVEAAGLDLAKKQTVVDGLEVKAPQDGAILDIQVSPGDTVGTSPIALLEDRSSMQVVISVDESYIGRIKPGQGAEIRADAFDGTVFKGRVSSTASKGVVKNGISTFQVSVEVENPAGLRSGMTANVSILLGSRDNTLLLPVDAIQGTGDRKLVIVRNGDTLVTREVKLGIVNTEYAEIKSGLKEGDTVVVRYPDSGKGAKKGFLGIGGF